MQRRSKRHQRSLHDGRNLVRAGEEFTSVAEGLALFALELV